MDGLVFYSSYKVWIFSHVNITVVYLSLAPVSNICLFPFKTTLARSLCYSVSRQKSDSGL